MQIPQDLNCPKCGLPLGEEQIYKTMTSVYYHYRCFYPDKEASPEGKLSNPKLALGNKKVPLHCVPCKPLLEVALAMMEGSRKYGTHNYRDVGVRFSTYYNAALRHLMDWWEGEDIDPDSGVHHLVKTMACLFVIRDSMHMENCTDDRPIQYPDKLNMEKWNKVVAEIIEKYPECKEPFTHISDRIKPVPGEY